MEISYHEMRDKEVINVREGKSYGKICDMVFRCPDGVITGIVVPGRRGWNPFKCSSELFIDWHKIKKIGRDVIIVDLWGGEVCEPGEDRPPRKPETCPPRNDSRRGRSSDIYLDDYE